MIFDEAKCCLHPITQLCKGQTRKWCFHRQLPVLRTSLICISIFRYIVDMLDFFKNISIWKNYFNDSPRSFPSSRFALRQEWSNWTSFFEPDHKLEGLLWGSMEGILIEGLVLEKSGKNTGVMVHKHWWVLDADPTCDTNGWIVQHWRAAFLSPAQFNNFFLPRPNHLYLKQHTSMINNYR